MLNIKIDYMYVMEMNISVVGYISNFNEQNVKIKRYEFIEYFFMKTRYSLYNGKYYTLF